MGKRLNMRINTERLRLVVGRGFAALLALAFCSPYLFAAQPAQAAAGDVTLEVQQSLRLDGSASYAPNTNFTYQLLAHADTNPLPRGSVAGAYSFNISGNASKGIDLSFTRTGFYYYDLVHTSPAQSDYTFDNSSFLVEVRVDYALRPSVVVSRATTNEKVAAIAFTHSYFRPEITPPVAASAAAGPGQPIFSAADIAAVQGLTAAEQEQAQAQVGDIAEDIAADAVPLGSTKVAGAWSLLSLILAVLGLALALVLVIIRLLKSPEDHSAERSPSTGAAPTAALTASAHEASSDSKSDQASPADLQTIQRRKTALAALAVCVVLAIIAMIFWLIIEDTSQPMVWINRYTAYVALAVLLSIAAGILSLLLLRHPSTGKTHEHQPATAATGRI